MLHVSSNTTDVVEYLEEVTKLQCTLHFGQFATETQDALQKKLSEAREHLVDILVLNKGSQNSGAKNQLMIPFENISKIERIGQGGFGTVFKGVVAGTLVAIKVAKDPSAVELHRLAEELEKMQKLSHPHLARFMGTTVVPQMGLAIVSELCEKDLSIVCQEKRTDGLHFQTQAVGWLCEAAEGIAWLHTMCHMLHRDVKPGNLLMKNGHVVVTDFGFTQALNTADETLREMNLRGSRRFIAPEMLRHQPFSYPADVYAFGITMYDVLSGPVPVAKEYKDNNELFEDVCRGVRPDISRLTSQAINDSLTELIIGCWDDSPQKRPTMLQVCSRLKEIFVETVVPQTNPAYTFWLNHFGDKLSDEVGLPELLNCLPNKEDKAVEEAYMWILKGRANPNIVTLRHLGNTFEWYGDWIHNGTAPSLKTVLGGQTWFLGLVSRQTAQEYGIDYVTFHHRPCFLVRCSETDPSRTPYTIDLFYTDHTVSRRVTRDGIRLSCPALNRADRPAASGNNIVELVGALLANDLVYGLSPYDGTVSRLRSSGAY